MMEREPKIIEHYPNGHRRDPDRNFRYYFIACTLTAITTALILGVNFTLKAITNGASPDFINGALFGFTFMGGLYGLILLLDPASRPGGDRSISEHDRSGNNLD